jgi:hypothetical protein
MLYRLLHLRKNKKQKTSNEGGWILSSGRVDNGGRVGALKQHHQPSSELPSPDSTNPKILAYLKYK